MKSLNPRLDAPGWWFTAPPEGTPIRRTALTAAQARDRVDPASITMMTVLGVPAVYHEHDRTILVIDPQHTPRAIADAAVEAALEGPEPILLRYHWDGWFHRLCDRAKLAQAVDDLRLVGNIASLSLPQVRVLGRGDVDPIFADVAQTPTRYRPDMVFFERRPSGMLHWKFIGPHAPVNTILGAEWARDVIGKPYDTGLWDPRFDQVTAEAYCRVEQTGEPHLSRVTGPLQTPHGVIQQSYTRLIVNVAGQLASYSQIDPAADLIGPSVPTSAPFRR